MPTKRIKRYNPVHKPCFEMEKCEHGSYVCDSDYSKLEECVINMLAHVVIVPTHTQYIGMGIYQSIPSLHITPETFNELAELVGSPVLPDMVHDSEFGWIQKGQAVMASPIPGSHHHNICFHDWNGVGGPYRVCKRCGALR